MKFGNDLDKEASRFKTCLESLSSMQALSVLIQKLYEIGVFQFGQFTLKSGLSSTFYIDLRRIISYPALLHQVSQLLYAKKTASYDLICGVPYTALPIATLISVDNNLPMVMRRKEKKAHGTQQDLEGVFRQGQTCLIVEDILTTGSSILETAQSLRNSGLIVKEAIIFIDREQGGCENLQKEGILARPVLRLHEVWKEILTVDSLKPHEKTIVEALVHA